MMHSNAIVGITISRGFLVLRRFCLVNETYQNPPRITSEAELLPRYNQPLNLTNTWRKTNKKRWNDWKTTTTLLYYQPTKDVWLLLRTKLTTLTKWTHLLTTNKLTKNLNATRRQHCNENLTAKYLRLKRLTLLTLNATIDWGALYHSHLNFTDYLNCTNLVYRCVL